MQLAVRDRLAYPAGYAPGIDPTHQFADGLKFSAASLSPGSMVDLTTGQPGTVTGTVSAVTNGVIGPAAKFPTAPTGSNDLTFSGKPGMTAGSLCTVGAVFVIDTTPSGTVYMFDSTNVAAGYGFGLTTGASGTGLTLRMDGGNVAYCTIPGGLVTGKPYFAVACFDGAAGVVNYACVSLDTGRIFSGTVSQSVENAGSTAVPQTYTVGDRNGSLFCQSSIAALFYSSPRRLMSIPELVAFCKDPWAFWYPSAAIDTPHVFSTLGGSLFHSFTQLVSVTATSTVVFGSKTIGKLVNVVSTSATSFLKSVAKSVLVSSVTTTTISALKAFLVAFTAGCATAVFTARGVGKLVAVTSTSAASFLKAVAKNFLVTSTSVTTVTARKLLVFAQTIAVTCTTSTVWTHVKNTFVAITQAMKLRPYSPNNYPTIEGSAQLYILAELKKISAAMNQHIEATKNLDKRLTSGGL